MTGKNIGVWLFIVLSISVCLTVSGCGTASKTANPAGANTNPESTVSAGTLSSDEETTSSPSTGFLPVVNVTASSNTVGAGSDVYLRAEAIDPAGAQVSLAWEASDGILTNVNGSSAVWQAPLMSSKSIVSCIATDVRGGKTQADVEIEVIGNSIYKLNIMADRSSLMNSVSSANTNSAYLPVAGARVFVKAFNATGVTDKNGDVEFNVTQTDKIAKTSEVTVNFKNWNITYNANMVAISGSVISDNLVFSPGYESVTIAQGKGDSFDAKRGCMEVTTTEQDTIGSQIPLSEVTIDSMCGQAVTSRDIGVAHLSSPYSYSAAEIKLSKTGYSTIEGYTVPISLDSVTLVNAEMKRNSCLSDMEATISWIKPYNYQTEVKVNEPFVVGFAQPMETSSAFNNISMMVQNKNTGEMIPITANEINSLFNVKWSGNTIAYLYPQTGYKSNTRYSILINNWSAKTVDGRYLKSYTGTYYEFETDNDPQPQIISFSPKNGDTDVNRSGPFSINFDRPIDPESLYTDTEIQVICLDTNASINLNGGSIRSFFSAFWKDNNQVLELVPKITLDARTRYQVRLKKCNFMSTTGKPVICPDNFWVQFTTGSL